MNRQELAVKFRERRTVELDLSVAARTQLITWARSVRDRDRLLETRAQHMAIFGEYDNCNLVICAVAERTEDLTDRELSEGVEHLVAIKHPSQVLEAVAAVLYYADPETQEKLKEGERLRSPQCYKGDKK